MKATKAASISYILDEVLALDKSIVLKFTSQKEVANFKAMLSVYLKRYNRKLESIGAGDLFEGMVPCFKNVPAPRIFGHIEISTDIFIELSLKKPKATPAFTIVEIKEATKDDSINRESNT